MFLKPLYIKPFKRWCGIITVFLFSSILSLKAQFQAGLNFTHPFPILINTDSIYYQTQTHGWLKFNTSNLANITGNTVTLKGALLSTSSKIISQDTVFVKSIIIYDSLMNIVFADTIKLVTDTLKINVDLNKDQNYWIDVVANYPCNSCTYNDAIIYGFSITLCPPYCIPPINPCVFSCTALSGTLTSSPPPHQKYCIYTNITINSSINFSASEFKMSPGAKIIIGNGGYLTIDSSHIYVCTPTGMWDGIKIYDPATNAASTGQLMIQNNSLIEDAHSAVSIPYGSPITWTNLLTITDAIFNKNDTAIAIRNYYPTVPTIGINSTIFTCRRIPYNVTYPFVPPTAYVAAVRGSNAYPLAALNSPYINSVTYPSVTTKAGSNANIGIYLYDVGTTVGSALPLTYNEIQIGFAFASPAYNPVQFMNIFDNMQEAGIYANNANFTCINNTFQNGAFNSITGKYGQGIFANATKSAKNYRLRVKPSTGAAAYIGSNYWGLGHNIFFDVSRAVNVKNYLDVEVTNCDIRSTQTASGLGHKGEMGIFDKTNRFYRHIINYNTLFNIEHAIVAFTDYGTINIPSVTAGFVVNAQYSNRLKIDSNIVQANYFYIPVTTQFVSNAIVTDNTAAPPGPAYITTQPITINGNTLKDVYRAIYVNSYFKKQVNTNINCITLRTDLTASLPLQYGITKKALTGNGFLSNQCIANDVKGPGSTNLNMTGILIDRTYNEVVRCNAVSKIYNAITFDNQSGICNFVGNNMTFYTMGYSLKNSSIIGQQGGPGSPSDNVFGPANCLTQFKTNVVSANPALSPLYVRPVPLSFNPDFCSAGSPPYGSSTPGTLFFTTGSIALPCPYNTVYHACADYFSPPLLLPPLPSLPLVSPTPSVALVQLMEKIAKNQTPMSALEQWQHQNFLYRYLSSDVSTRNASSVLNSFYTGTLSIAHQNISDIENDLFNGQLTSAQFKLSNWNTQNVMENTLKAYYQLRLNYALHNEQLTSTDSTQLYNIAASCEQTNGYGVSFARSFYNMVYDQIILWKDQCSNTNGQKQKYNTTADQNISTAAPADLLVYPNPTTEQAVQLWCDECQNIRQIKVVDLGGKVIYENSKDEFLFPYSLNFQLPVGVYLIYVTDANGLIRTQKFIVQDK